MDQGGKYKGFKNESMDKMGKLFNHSSTLQSKDSDRLNAIVKGLPLEENEDSGLVLNQHKPFDVESQSVISSSVASEFLPKLGPEHHLIIESESGFSDKSSEDRTGDETDVVLQKN